MPISWNEIRHNAVGFSRRWAGATSETAEKQTFWNEFFQAFGLQSRLVATFEEPVRRITGQHGHIDLFWKRIPHRNDLPKRDELYFREPPPKGPDFQEILAQMRGAGRSRPA